MQRDPRKETFLQMLHTTFCPTLTWKSFITIACLTETAVFITAAIVSIVTGGLEEKIFLGANKTVLNNLDRYPYGIVHSYQIWRLATCVVLHTGFSHWLMNMFTQIIFGSWLEAMVGW
jgi:membrane associated rhomboid family serine protease